MTLDEAIVHCELKAQELLSDKQECSLEHTQLAEWLKKLKRYQEGVYEKQ